MTSILHKIKFKPSILTQILFYCLGVFAASAILTSYYSYKQNEESFIRISKELVDKTSKRLISNSMAFLVKSKTVAVVGDNFITTQADISTDNHKLLEYMFDSLDTYPHISSIYVGDQQGNFIQARRIEKDAIYRTKYKTLIPKNVKYALRVISTKEGTRQSRWSYLSGVREVIDEETIPSPEYDPRGRGWYNLAKTNIDFTWSDIYIFNSTREPGITAAQPIMENNKLLCVFAVDIEMKKIGEFLKLSKINADDVSIIFNRKGEIISHSNINNTIVQHQGQLRTMLINDLSDIRLSRLFNDFTHKGRTHTTFDYNDRRFISFVTPFPKDIGKEWFYGLAVPISVFIGELEQTQREILFITLLLVGLFSVLLFFLARKISRPIQELAQEAEKIEQFDLEERPLEKTSIREILRLQNSLSSAKKNIRMFTQFLPKNLVRKFMLQNKDLKIGGVEKKLALFFSDIEGFTKISEKYTPDMLANHLSEYFEEVTHILTQNNATIDKYIGDAVMAFWGAPQADKNAAVNACRSALYIQNRLFHLNKKWKSEGKLPLKTRIGLHLGDVIVGNIGSSDRINYTVIGDNVNLSARLEGLNKAYDTQILISHDMYEAVQKDMVAHPVDFVAVKGKKKGVKVYTLLGQKKGDPVLIAENKVAYFSEEFTKAFDFYINRNWTEALRILQDLRETYGNLKMLCLYIERCQEFKKSPPPQDWTGVVVMTEK